MGSGSSLTVTKARKMRCLPSNVTVAKKEKKKQSRKPDLLAEVQQLRKENKRLRKALASIAKIAAGYEHDRDEEDEYRELLQDVDDQIEAGPGRPEVVIEKI